MINVCAAVVFNGSHFLVTTRPNAKAWAGYYEFPGGKIEPNETPAMCVKRELREELSLDVCVLDLLMNTVFSYPDKKVNLLFYRCIPLNINTLCAMESQEFRWVLPSELKNLKFLPADKDVARYLSAYPSTAR